MQTVELGPTDAVELARLYEAYDWWAERTVPEVRAALADSIALGVRDDGDLVASARVVTDGVYYATCYDVVVREDRRSEGVGEELLDAVVSHPALADVFLSLTCREGLVPFYERAGFEPYPSPVERPDGPAEEMVHLYRPRADD
ncbi:GNAT family N-acetyltransferase [Salinirubellus salinus]|jgi:GNAT superfamily N-acetyltransferase|uniref:GNAT family N-acetyltransferase n=1 Tax=Salinirubellus salinus TaxID=1364945 RepID=A0A9E7R2S7_9EURY|nr:GNAT family N-acetyltransferase [Salinirubellus salinus]UWM54654.1 GNAT family N-acetyltransferase [Salinirubellus salinus]UWM54725.1 GNAT family N-acetyltransferase [Salinirubellus salinus]